MRKLVLLYKDISSKEISIKEYNIISDIGKYYLFDKNNPYTREGILKKYVDKICNNQNYLKTYPVELPYCIRYYYREVIFIFVNKNKYDRDPIKYLNLIDKYNNTK